MGQDGQQQQQQPVEPQEGEGGVESPVPEACLTDSALASDSDHPWGDQHSSEEELECINGTDDVILLDEELDVVSSPVSSVSSVSSVSPATTAAATGDTRHQTLRFGPSAFGPPNVPRQPFHVLFQPNFTYSCNFKLKLKLKLIVEKLAFSGSGKAEVGSSESGSGFVVRRRWSHALIRIRSHPHQNASAFRLSRIRSVRRK